MFTKAMNPSVIAMSVTQQDNKHNSKQSARALTGSVTKLLDNFGFIDDSVFFQLSVVKGDQCVSVGDKVYCECTYSEHLPFKWNATKVQIVNKHNSSSMTTTNTVRARTHAHSEDAFGENSSAFNSSSHVLTDFQKAQQAVVAAQQLAQYYCSQQQTQSQTYAGVQYTSTPGTAFIHGVDSSGGNGHTKQTYGTKVARNQWSQPSEFVARARAGQKGRGDEFGRDARQQTRERERERERERIERERKELRSESPHQQRVRSRVRYETVNIPKLSIMKTVLNSVDVKQRYSLSIHIPSDLECILVNDNFSLNVNEIPKPVSYRMKETKREKEVSGDESGSNGGKVVGETEKGVVVNNSNGNGSESAVGKGKERSDRFNVKVLLISLPKMNEIFDRMFGQDVDGGNSADKPTKAQPKPYFVHFNKLLSFLVSRNQNDGFSLIGGKWTHADGYLDSEEREPDLIKTCVRVVYDACAINLSKCSKWREIAQFVYNRENSLSNTCSVEKTTVLMADIWTAFDSLYEPLNIKNANNLIDLNLNKEQNNSINLEKNETKSSDKTDSEFISVPETETAVDSVEDNSDNTSGVEISDCRSSVVVNDSVVSDQQNVVSLSPELEKSSSDDIIQQSNDTTEDDGITASTDIQMTSEIAATEETTVDDSGERAVVDDDTNSCSVASISGTDVTSQTVTETEPMSGEHVEESVVSQTESEHKMAEKHSIARELLSRVHELKVTELRAELEAREIHLKGKKSELSEKLREVLEKEMDDRVTTADDRDDDCVNDDVKSEYWKQKVIHDSDKREDIEGGSEGAELEGEATPGQMEVQEEAEEEGRAEEAVVMETETSEDKEETKESLKRKNDAQEEEVEAEVEVKRVRVASSESEKAVERVVEGSVSVQNNNSAQTLTVVTLHEALNHQRYDQFEFAITSELMRESLIKHFSHFLISCLEFNKALLKDNTNETETTEVLRAKVNYVHLSFAYFDANHCGYVLAEDLMKLCANANFNVSKKTFQALVQNNEKVFYRDFKEPQTLLDLKRRAQTHSEDKVLKTSDEAVVFERNGVLYEMRELVARYEGELTKGIRMGEELEKLREKSLKESLEMREMLDKQKKMNSGLEKLNDEICALKRERDSLVRKCESFRKCLESCVQNFSQLLKD